MPPYRAQTKGKVERPVSYIRRNFFYGRDFASDDDLNARALLWLDGVANVRIHGTLKEGVADRFERERPCLSPSAPWPYRPVVPQPEPRTTRTRPPSGLQVVEVERRPLSEYAGITGEIS